MESWIEKITHSAKHEQASQISFMKLLLEGYRNKEYAKAGYNNLFTFLSQKLQFSDGAAGRRNRAIRVFDKFPLLFQSYCLGKIPLDHISLVASVIDEDNFLKIHQILVSKSSTKEIKEWLVLNTGQAAGPVKPQIRPIVVNSPNNINADQRPCEDQHENKDELRPLETMNTDQANSDLFNTSTVQKSSSGAEGINLDSYKENLESDIVNQVSTQLAFRLSITLTEEQKAKLDRALEVSSHSNSTLSIEKVIEMALDSLLEKKDPVKKQARAEKRKERKNQPKDRKTPKKTGEKMAQKRGNIPQHIERAVLSRDSYQCTYTSKDGTRCGAKSFLEIDHRIPVSCGGTSDISNLRSVCRCHNQLLADEIFGREFMDGKRYRNDAGP